MKEMIMELLFAAITAAVPVLAGFVISYINKAKDKAVAQTDDTKDTGLYRRDCTGHFRRSCGDEPNVC